MKTYGILLSAGFGTRLKPLTDKIPKPAVPFLGRPMAWYAMHALKQTGVATLAANVHHLPDIMADCLQKCAQNLGLPEVHIFRENGEILGTGGGARSCLSLIPDADRYIIYHGDVLCNADLRAALKSHDSSGCDVTLVVAPRPQNSKLGMIGLDSNHHIVQIRDWFRADYDVSQLPVPACFTGIHIIEHRLLETLELGKNICLVTEIYRRMLEQNRPINACMTDAFFADIGTPETYFEAQNAVWNHPELLSGTDPRLFPSKLVEDWSEFCHSICRSVV